MTTDITICETELGLLATFSRNRPAFDKAVSEYDNRFPKLIMPFFFRGGFVRLEYDAVKKKFTTITYCHAVTEVKNKRGVVVNYESHYTEMEIPEEYLK